MTLALFLGLGAFYSLTLALRLGLALAQFRRCAADAPLPEDEAGVTVLQAILGGDPRLIDCLTRNLQNAPRARFVWLLDRDDSHGRAAARQAIRASAREDVRELLLEPPPDDVNPKVFKLLAASGLVETPWLAVLDDDTVLPPGTLGRGAALARAGCLVTGLPVYCARRTLWSRLLSGFVNGNALLTYPPMARLGASRTINGMFSLMRRTDLTGRGGFTPLLGEVTDDYALARLFLEQQGRIVQSCLWHPIETTVASGGDYWRLMRRWMVFARIYTLENRDPATLLLIVLPGLLALPLLGLGLALGPLALGLALALLLTKAGAARWLAARCCGVSAPPGDLVHAVVAELLLPVQVVGAFFRPDRVRWRGRVLRLRGSRVVGG